MKGPIIYFLIADLSQDMNRVFSFRTFSWMNCSPSILTQMKKSNKYKSSLIWLVFDCPVLIFYLRAIKTKNEKLKIVSHGVCCILCYKYYEGIVCLAKNVNPALTLLKAETNIPLLYYFSYMRNNGSIHLKKQTNNLIYYYDINLL